MFSWGINALMARIVPKPPNPESKIPMLSVLIIGDGELLADPDGITWQLVELLDSIYRCMVGPRDLFQRIARFHAVGLRSLLNRRFDAVSNGFGKGRQCIF